MTLFSLAAGGWLAAMAVVSQSGPIGSSPLPYALGYISGFVLTGVIVRTCPRRWSFGQVAAAAVLMGLLGRLVFFWSFPAGNDVYRYIWEGYVQLQGDNPYRLAPDDPALAHLIRGEMGAVWPSINHKDLSAVYPPLVMLLFRALAAISPSTQCFKAAMLGFDLVVLAVLVCLVRRHKTSGAHLFWYALNPLVLVYGAGEGHVDIVQAACLVTGLGLLCAHKPVAGFTAIGAAAVSKYFSAAALPFVMKRANRFAWPAVALPLLCFLPFADAPAAVFKSLAIFGTQMHYNDGLAEVLRFCLGSAALPCLILLVVCLLAAIYLLEHDGLRSVYLAMGAVLVCLPTLHPWYLLLIAPFMALYPSRAWLFLMAAMVVTLPVLVHEVQTGVFQEIKWLKWIAYLPFYGLLLFGALKPDPRQPKASFETPQTVSVIMPVLNEAAGIREAIRGVRGEPEVVQLVVVDGGSGDETPVLARQSGAELVSAPRGRGCQVAAGIRRAVGDVVLVLHADATLAPGAMERMLKALGEAPAIPGGAFEMAFESPSWKLTWIAALNNWRARYAGIAFGDQGQFVRRSALEAMGGYPDMRLMEDVELSMRLKRFGRPLLVRSGVRVSPRRWVERDFSGNAWKVMTLFVRYLAERRFCGPDNIRTDYYHKYYGRF